MHNLIAFLVKNSSWFVCIILEVICFYFIFSYNAYQRSIYLSSSNELVGRVYEVSGNVVSYIGLRDVNEDLLIKNAELQNRILSLEDYIHNKFVDTIQTHAIIKDSIHGNQYNFIVARVLNNSISQIENYITINKGSKDGLYKDMGVISQQGIVGIVTNISENYAVIQSIIHPKTALSCNVKGTPGTLTWDAKDYRYASLKGFPRFESFEIGDTVRTSGHSAMFPEGVMVGVIEDSDDDRSNDNFLVLRIKLTTDFASLKDILVIDNKNKSELSDLESEINKNSR